MIFCLVFMSVVATTFSHIGSLPGCYNETSQLQTKRIPNIRYSQQCIDMCTKMYYRYVYLQKDCVCSNDQGEQISQTSCEHCDQCEPGPEKHALYDTGVLVPGPPQNVVISNITSNSLSITWNTPESYTNIVSYQIEAQIIKTFSTFYPDSPKWIYSNNTFKATIITLHPSTTYNISISTLSQYGKGGTVSQIIETPLAEPDIPPTTPSIIKRDGKQMTIKIIPSTNNNGPITAYRIIIIDDDAKEGFDKSTVMSYADAQKNGLSYYITAEIPPKDVEQNFIIGDGNSYGGYFNAPLNPDINYKVIICIVSTLNNLTKVRYSTETGIQLLNVVIDKDDGDNSSVIIGLSVAIALATCALIGGIVGFLILMAKIANRQLRASDNQELTLRGPMIEVENNGYIYEEEYQPKNYYTNLKQKITTFSPKQIKIEPTNLLGTGKFGRVNSGTVNQNDTLIPIAAYSIQDKKMNQETRKSMLQELDLLIKTGNHPNVIQLIGTCETSQMVIVALEYLSMNLKDLLLSSRDSLPAGFSSLSEEQALDIAVQISKGMAHLETCKIVHKQLCARSVLITNGFTPKIGSYGLAQYYSHNKIPDYTRWTAVEVFKGQPHNPKSDVWSFGCVLWEICVLGGTPYGNISNTNEIPERIMKGLRLPQLSYISDELYHTMLDCWQVDPDERPKFTNLIESISGLMNMRFMKCLNFNLNSNFQYEQFYTDMELSHRPVF